jgi:hypothetical protein
LVEKHSFGRGTAMSAVGFRLCHGCHGEMQFFRFVILKWRITLLMDEKMTNVAAFSNVALMP